jgi:integration host factor subunit beta
MLKSELVRLILHQNRHLYERDVEKIINAMLDAMVAALARGDRVEIRGFGSFLVRSRRARTGCNPKTGAAWAVEKRGHPFFKRGKEMRARLKNDVLLEE